MAGRGNSGSKDSLFRSTFASIRGRAPSIFRLFGATFEDNVINGQVPDNVEQAHEPAGEQAVVENHRGVETGSFNREVTTLQNGRQFRIDLNVCPEDAETAEVATAGVEVRLPEQQATTSINGTPREEEEQTNVGCETHAAINFILPDLNEPFSMDAAEHEVERRSNGATAASEGPSVGVEEDERKRKGKAIAYGSVSGAKSDRRQMEEAYAIEKRQLKEVCRDSRKTYEASKGELVGCSRDFELIPRVDGVEDGNAAPDAITGADFDRRQSEGRDAEFERHLKEACAESLETYATELRARSLSRAPESRIAEGRVVSFDDGSASIPMMDAVDDGANDVAPDVVPLPGCESLKRAKNVKPSKTLDGRKKMKAKKRKTPDAVTGDESPKLRGKNLKPSETLDGNKKRKTLKWKTPVGVTDNDSGRTTSAGPTKAPPRRNPRCGTQQEPFENPHLLADAIDIPSVASTSRPKWKRLHACMASEVANGHVPYVPIEEHDEDADDAVPMDPADETIDVGPLVPVDEPTDDVPVGPVDEPNNVVHVDPTETPDDVSLASLIKRKVGRPKKNKRRKVFKPKPSWFSEDKQTSQYVPKGYLKRTVRSNEDRMGVAHFEVSAPHYQVGGPSIFGLGSGVNQTNGIDVHMNVPETDPLGDDGVDVANRDAAGQRDQEGGSEPLKFGRPTTYVLDPVMGRAVEGTSRGAETASLDMADHEEPGPSDQGVSEQPELSGPATSGLPSEEGRAGEGTRQGDQTVVPRPWYRDFMAGLNQNPADSSFDSLARFRRRR